jgi:DNA-binding transcriptional regulator YdaS (Cro superfamily)
MRAMTLSEWLSEERGRTRDLAVALGVSGSLVTQWARCKPVSAERCVPIEGFTEGAVRRWDLRPFDWHLVWPELIGAEGAPPVPEAIEKAAA